MNNDVYSYISTLLANIPRFYAIKCFISVFVRKSECKWKYMGILYVMALIWTCSIYVIFVSPAFNIFSNITALFLLVIPYKIRWAKKVFAVFTIYVINALVDIIVTFFMTDPVVGQLGVPIYGYVISLLFLLVAVFFEHTVGSEATCSLPIMNMLALILIPIGSIGCIYWLAIEMRQASKVVFTVATILLFFNIFIFYLYHSLLEFYSSKMKEQIFQQMMEVYSYQLDVVKGSEKRVKALRHDMKHHMIELASLARKNKTEEIIRYLEEMKEFMLDPRDQVHTGDKDIDGILNYLLQNANETLSKVDLKINIPEELKLNQFYVCVILGNLVDNAVKAASKSSEKYLSIKMALKQGVFITEIKNSYSEKIIEKNGKFQTTQLKPSIHGIGLENVKKVIEDLGGEIQIDYTEKYFCVRVLLYMEKWKDEET